VVFATGGFVALPVVIAAAAARRPVVIHEQTAVPGLANRIAARVARHVAVSFAGAATAFPAAKVVVTGNPLRPELRDGSREEALRRLGLDAALPLIYVTGGAQGAHRVNRVVGTALPGLLEHAQVIHQCGDHPTTGDRAWLQERRRALPEALARRYTVVPYVTDELASIYAAARLVIGRAGAGTVNECCQLGLPALYIPLPSARGGEQLANATLVARAGAAVVLPQPSLTPERLVAEVDELLARPHELDRMGERAGQLAVPDAAERLATLVLSCAVPVASPGGRT
jgi:UDP-N-acetylglucosamine--N-acetylmuramyl-(pentapeptide) pyrophosphoryl-undecaprenol N-acetylglucosamine transferase